MTTDRLSPVVLTAPVAAAAVVLVTGWATAQSGADAEAATPAPVKAAKVVDASRQGSPEARVLRAAVRSERAEVRHLEHALDRARARLAAEQRKSTVVVAAASTPSTSISVSSGSSGGSASSGGGSGSSGSGSGGSSGSGGGSTTTQAPATDTTTSGS
jgi:uncharacterized membrane protein YgcG